MTTKNEGIDAAIAEFSEEIAAEHAASDTESQSSGEQVADADTFENIGDLEEMFGVSEESEEDAESESDESEEESNESEEDSEDSEEDSEESEEESQELPDVEYVKADGKKVKIDYTDRDHIKRVYQKYAAQARYQSERDSYKAQLDEAIESNSKNAELIGLLNENIEDPAEMYRLFTGGKNLKDQFAEWQKEQDQFALMSEAEQKAYLSAKEIDKRQKELDRREAKILADQEKAEAEKSEANLTFQQSLVKTSFEKHRFNEVTDVNEAEKLDRLLWTAVKSELSAYETLNKEIVEKVTSEKAEEMRSLLGKNNRVTKKEAVKKEKKSAKKAAAKAVAPKNNEEPSMVDGLASMMGLNF